MNSGCSLGTDFVNGQVRYSRRHCDWKIYTDEVPAHFLRLQFISVYTFRWFGGGGGGGWI